MNEKIIKREERSNFFADIITAIDHPENINEKPALIKRLLVARAEEIKVQKPSLEKFNAKPAVNFTQRLNALIAAGVSFEVEPDDFQAFGASERETAFLRDNRTAILCTLHQSALVKYLSPSDLQMFKAEINERTAIISDGETIEPPFEIVADVARDWFIDVMEELLTR